MTIFDKQFFRELRSANPIRKAIGWLLQWPVIALLHLTILRQMRGRP